MGTYDAKTLIELLQRDGVFWAKFAYDCKAADEAEIRKVLANVERASKKRQPAHSGLLSAATYLKAMVGDATGPELVRCWQKAMTGLDGIQAYQYASRKQKAAKLASLARDGQFVAAWQAAAVGADWLPLDVLSLLLVDATDASIDALLPHVERALTDPERLAMFEEAARYETPATAALFARMRGELSSQRAASPVLALGERFGLASKGRFRLTVEVRATKPAKRTRTEVTYDVATVTFDSNNDPGFGLSRGQRSRTQGAGSTGSSSWARGVACSLDTLPQALAKLATKDHLEWDFDAVTTRPLGPKRAAALLDWLRGS